jgi:LmbE family N-acetylglucosaminyl deacetylase
MNVLAVGAHPDDLEIICAGTLAKYSLNGDKVFMASLTNGNMGHPEIRPGEMSKIREEEMRNSASVIGAEVIWIGVDDELSEVNVEARLRMVDVFRYAKPDVIITHSIDDYHVDHRNTAQLVNDAAPLACVHNIVRNLKQLDKQPLIYTMDNLAGIGFVPQEFVDIGDTLEIKKKMFLCHKSQVEWMAKATGFDFLDVIETVAKFRGYNAGVEYAEAFKRVDAFYKGTTMRILP